MIHRKPCAALLVAGVLSCAGLVQAEQASAPAAAQALDDPLLSRLKSRVARVGGLTAADAARRAVATSTADRSQQADVDAADSEVDRAKVGYFPRVSLTARYTRLSPITPPAFGGSLVVSGDPPGTPRSPNTLNISPATLFPVILDQYLLQAQVLVPLSDYVFRLRQSHAAASESKEAAVLTEEAVRRAVATRAKIEYYAWAAAKMQQAVTEQSVEQAEHHLALAKAGRDTGRTPNVEVLRAESLLSGSKLIDERAKNAALLSEAELHTMLHDPPARSYEIGEDLLAPIEGDDAGDPETLYAEALRRRPDMRAFSRNDASLENQRKATTAVGAPRLDGFGNAYLANPNVGSPGTELEFAL